METITKEQINSDNFYERLVNLIILCELYVFAESIHKGRVFFILSELIPEGANMRDWSVEYLGCGDRVYYIENPEKSVPEQIAHNSKELTDINSLEYTIWYLIGEYLKSLEELSEAAKEQKADHITNKEEQS
jgi:hypothetical protein